MEQEGAVVNMSNYPVAPEYVFDNLDSLRKFRRAMKWGIKRVARLANLDKEYYDQIELGYIFPPQYVYNELAKIFDWEEWK